MEEQGITRYEPAGEWVAVDFDRTLASYDKWRGASHAGPAILLTVERVRLLIALGIGVRIFTARVCSKYSNAERDAARRRIELFCIEHFNCILPVTSEKDGDCIEIWDDIALCHEANTGRVYHPSRIVQLNIMPEHFVSDAPFFALQEYALKGEPKAEA